VQRRRQPQQKFPGWCCVSAHGIIVTLMIPWVKKRASGWVGEVAVLSHVRLGFPLPTPVTMTRPTTRPLHATGGFAERHPDADLGDALRHGVGDDGVRMALFRLLPARIHVRA
jgi:hypothetical protein